MREWAGTAGRDDVVLLDGFHALKHALRFGAEVLLVVAEEPEGVRALAAGLAPDVEEAVARLLRRGPLK
ncbi:rRNA methyltransferase, partial [Streptomyces sp. RSD-27]